MRETEAKNSRRKRKRVSFREGRKKRKEITRYWQEWGKKPEESNSTFASSMPEEQEVNLKVLLIGQT